MPVYTALVDHYLTEYSFSYIRIPSLNGLAFIQPISVIIFSYV